MRRIKCWLGFHKRSRGMTRYDRDGYLRSRCRHCRTPMVMTDRNSWAIDRTAAGAGSVPAI